MIESHPVRSMNFASASGFVLIGGRSRRLGIDKATYPIGGVPAADRLASRLLEVCRGGVVLVGREGAPWSSHPCVPDSRAGIGPVSGLLTSLERCDTEYAFVLATDLWNVTSAGLESVLSDMSEIHEGSFADVTYAATAAGRGQPLCSVWRVESVLATVRRRIDSGDLSMFGILDDVHAKPVILDDAQLRNVNEPQDLELFLREVLGER